MKNNRVIREKEQLKFEQEVDLVITDPYYICNVTSAENKNCKPSYASIQPGDPFIEHNTFNGDWSCQMIAASSNKNTVIGQFCAKIDKVCITTMDFARKLCKDADYWDNWVKEHSQCVTIIPNFKGMAQISVLDSRGFIDPEDIYVEVDLFSPEGKLLYYSVQDDL